MADEKLNVSPEENPQPSLFDAGPAGAPAQDAPTPENAPRADWRRTTRPGCPGWCSRRGECLR